MDKYNWLLKKQRKALVAFSEAKKSLDTLYVSFQNEIQNSKDRIEGFKGSIQEEEEAVAFLKIQSEIVTKQSTKIAALLE